MPRDSGGAYSLPSGYLATTGQTILASQHNPPLEDIATALTGSLPRNGSAPMQADLAMAGYKITGLDDGTADDDAATVGQVNGVVPIGVVVDFAGTVAPTGWLMCYGQAISRSTYDDLFSVIGTTFGVGDGSTTFNLPDLRGRVTAGKDDMGGTSADRLTNQTGGLNGDTLGATGGAETHALTTAQLASHSHAAGTLATASDGAHSHNTTIFAVPNAGYQLEGGNDVNLGPQSQASSTSGAHTHTITGSTASAGSGTAHNNVQPTLILNKMIRATA